jgi:hypothetical protein
VIGWKSYRLSSMWSLIFFSCDRLASRSYPYWIRRTLASFYCLAASFLEAGDLGMYLPCLMTMLGAGDFEFFIIVG